MTKYIKLLLVPMVFISSAIASEISGPTDVVRSGKADRGVLNPIVKKESADDALTRLKNEDLNRIDADKESAAQRKISERRLAEDTARSKANADEFLNRKPDQKGYDRNQESIDKEKSNLKKKGRATKGNDNKTKNKSYKKNKKIAKKIARKKLSQEKKDQIAKTKALRKEQEINFKAGKNFDQKGDLVEKKTTKPGIMNKIGSMFKSKQKAPQGQPMRKK